MATETKPKEKKPERIISKPLPNAVDGQDWKIREAPFGTGSLDNRTLTMSVPLGITPQERQTKNHEMLHQKFSPKSPPKLNPQEIDPLIYQACEDFRVNFRGKRIGVAINEVRTLSDADIDRWSKAWEDKPQVAAAALMAATYSQDFSPIWERVQEDLPEDAYNIERMVCNAVYMIKERSNPSHNATLKAARYLTGEVLPPPESKDGDGGSKDAKDGPSSAQIQKDVHKGVQTLKERLRTRVAGYSDRYGTLDRSLKEYDSKRDGDVPTWSDSARRWGDMRIKHVPLPLALPARMRGRRWKATNMGAVFRYPQRWCADQTIFAQKGVKEGGCTLLIDNSGSMHLDSDQVLEIMQYMPAALIASYEGRAGHGILKVVARKGRRASAHDLERTLGGNTVDGPALRWLGKQPGPRYWVSDGMVTGCDDRYHSDLGAEAVRICQHYSIMRIDSMDEVVEKFKQFREAR
ncbi:MAG: hypothetical protein OJJ55_06600 [Rhodococcus sp.]|nr:hypothetical protein [Rhodococcus sp. (in: high G+C Gram-positive bacteria)]